nr:MAG TPA: hypothetical protein [Caudoviricetes sp.]
MVYRENRRLSQIFLLLFLEMNEKELTAVEVR